MARPLPSAQGVVRWRAGAALYLTCPGTMPDAIIACSCRPVTCSAGTLVRQRPVHERCPHTAAPVDAVRKSLMAAGAFTAAAARPESGAGAWDASAARSEVRADALHVRADALRSPERAWCRTVVFRVRGKFLGAMQNAECMLKRMSLEQLKTLLVIHRGSHGCGLRACVCVAATAVACARASAQQKLGFSFVRALSAQSLRVP